MDKLEKQGTQIDILVNNAGSSIHAPVEKTTEDELRGMMETLYFGPAKLIQGVLPYMRKWRFGVVVNMSSGAGLEGFESTGGYAAAKAALDGKPTAAHIGIRPRKKKGVGLTNQNRLYQGPRQGDCRVRGAGSYRPARRFKHEYRKCRACGQDAAAGRLQGIGGGSIRFHDGQWKLQT